MWLPSLESVEGVQTTLPTTQAALIDYYQLQDTGLPPVLPISNPLSVSKTPVVSPQYQDSSKKRIILSPLRDPNNAPEFMAHYQGFLPRIT